MYYTDICNDFVYVCITVYHALSRVEWIFRVFEGSFLEAPWAVLFHATAMHCHHGMDIDDASCFVECYKSAPSLSQPEKLMSELSCHEKSSQDEKLVVKT